MENSILHGFEGRKEGGHIRICGEGYRELLRITIEDNGCGMNQGQRDLIREVLRNPGSEKKCDMGIGIRNVIMRMKMYYGEDFQTELWTEEGKGHGLYLRCRCRRRNCTGSRIRQVTGYPFDKAHRMEDAGWTLWEHTEHSSRKQKIGGNTLRILIAEDEPRAMRGLKNLITSISPDYQVVAEAADGRQALEMLKQQKPEVVFTDLKMPYMDGMALIRTAHALESPAEFVLVTAYEEFEVAREAIGLGVFDYLVKRSQSRMQCVYWSGFQQSLAGRRSIWRRCLFAISIRRRIHWSAKRCTSLRRAMPRS